MNHSLYTKGGSMLVTIYEIYLSETLPEFNAYVDRYCIKHNITPEEACRHALILETWKLYRDKPKIEKGEDNVHTNCDYGDDRSC